jgi:hypothetical protein
MRDAYGMGVEYEGGRPGWNDAMNGLPGMVGSGMPETYEMYLLLKYVRDIVKTYKRGLIVPDELHVMVTTINNALDELEDSGYTDEEVLPLDVPDDLFHYWDIVAAARESYRNDVQYYFSGNTTEIAAHNVVSMLDRWIHQSRAWSETCHANSCRVVATMAPQELLLAIPHTRLRNGNSTEENAVVSLGQCLVHACRNLPLFSKGLSVT